MSEIPEGNRPGLTRPLVDISTASVMSSSVPAASKASTSSHSDQRSRRASSVGSEESNAKRAKTGRACDSCRRKKIKCDILPKFAVPVCAHCKHRNTECTFYMPMSETRFKKKDGSSSMIPARPPDLDLELAPAAFSDQANQKLMRGNTSLTYLLHSIVTLPQKLLRDYDARHSATWESTSDGDGFIRLLLNPTASSDIPKLVEGALERDIVEKLVNIYFDTVAPLIPFILKEEFLAISSPPLVLLYSICGSAALSRDVPKIILDATRQDIHGLFKSYDVLSNTSIHTIQALAILCLHPDSQDANLATSSSFLWNRLGTAIRMSHNLGLHRENPSGDGSKSGFKKRKIDLYEETKEREMRRRLWGAMVVLDRLIGITLGLPQMINPADCDVLLPSPYLITKPKGRGPAPSLENGGVYDNSCAPYSAYINLITISVIMGKIVQAIYSPAGLNYTTDSQLYSLLNELYQWKDQLPANLKFFGASSNRESGLLHLYFTISLWLLFRVFLRISFDLPTHLTFTLSVSTWSMVAQCSADSIAFLECNESLLDHIVFVGYSLSACALVLYHTWARRQEVVALELLRRAKELICRWKKDNGAGDMSMKGKLCDIISLLYDNALKLEGQLGPYLNPDLNPTAGVKPKSLKSPLAWKTLEHSSENGTGFNDAASEVKAEVNEDLPFQYSQLSSKSAPNMTYGSESGGGGQYLGNPTNPTRVLSRKFSDLQQSKLYTDYVEAGPASAPVLDSDRVWKETLSQNPLPVSPNLASGFPADILKWDGTFSSFPDFQLNFGM